MSKNKESQTNILKNRTTQIVLSVIVFFALFIGLFAIGIYRYKWENNITRAVASIIPYPAAKVGGSYVSYSKYLDKVDALKDYQKDFKNVDFNTEKGKKALKEIKATTLDQMIEEIVIAKEAKKMGVSVSRDEFNASFKDLLESNGGEEKVKENLEKYYNNMSLAEFKEQYKAKMLRAKLSEKVGKDESINANARKKAENILKQLKDGGDFATLAKKNSEDATSASKGGDLGFFGKGKNVPELEKAVFSLKKGQVSGIIKTVYGYHIIKVTDKKDDKVRASQILIKTPDFNEWLKKKVAEYKVKKYIKV